MYFKQVVGEPGWKQTCQQEESYSSPIGILLLLQLSSYKPILIVEQNIAQKQTQTQTLKLKAQKCKPCQFSKLPYLHILPQELSIWHRLIHSLEHGHSHAFYKTNELNVVHRYDSDINGGQHYIFDRRGQLKFGELENTEKVEPQTSDKSSSGCTHDTPDEFILR